MVFDISYPHDPRVRLDKFSISAAEIDALLVDPHQSDEIKRLVLADVTPQGYEPKQI